MKKILLTGASGMVGQLILQESLQAKEVGSVISLVRKETSLAHPKLKEIQIADFVSYNLALNELNDLDTIYFCIGAYSGQVPNDKFEEITVDYPVALAKLIKEKSPKATFCLLSGQGADRTEKSRVAFARFKGMAENKIDQLQLHDFYTFRPGYIYPVTPRNEPNLMYRISRYLYPLIKIFGKNTSIKSTELAETMFKIGLQGANLKILENKDIMAEFEKFN